MNSHFFRLFLLLPLLLVSTGDLLAQEAWEKYPGNPVLSGQPGTWHAVLSMNSVLYNADSSRYEMWFACAAQDGPPFAIGFAWSSDGVAWNVHSPGPVLGPSAGSWDAYYVMGPYVLRDSGQYKMWYTGISPGGLTGQIGYATSPDGISWTKHPSNPVLAPGTASWESASAIYGCVIPDSSGYRMWYGGISSDVSQSGIGLATSLDGISWTKHASNPLLVSGAIGAWDHIVFGPRVVMVSGTFYMYYSGEVSHYQSDRIGLATSSDGLLWTRHPSNPVLGPTPGAWDANRVILGSVLMDAVDPRNLKMYYCSPTTGHIGLATGLLESVESEIAQPRAFVLSQNYPNPFNPTTVISYQLPVISNVDLRVFDLLGREVAVLVNEEKPPGSYTVTWNAGGMASGVYLYKIQAERFIETKKLLLLK